MSEWKDVSRGGLFRSFGARAALTHGARGSGSAGARMVRAAGFSLVEVLVAVLVLSIGLLGLAGLQIAGVRANDSARLRTEVTIAAYDAADRLRADTASFFPLGQGSSGTAVIEADACEGAQSSADAISRWRRDFCALGLPPPSSGDFARLDCQDSNPCGAGNCAIIVRWDDRRGDRRSPGDAETTVLTDQEFRFCTRIATAI